MYNLNIYILYLSLFTLDGKPRIAMFFFFLLYFNFQLNLRERKKIVKNQLKCCHPFRFVVRVFLLKLEFANNTVIVTSGKKVTSSF